MPDDDTLPLAPAKPTRSARRRANKAKAKTSTKDVSGTGDIMVAVGNALLGGNPRQTLPVNANVLGALPWAYLPRRQYQSLDLTTITPGAFSPQQLLEVLCDADPNVSLALWNFQRLAAAGFQYEVRTPDNTAEDPDGKAILDEIVGKVNANWGGMAALINQWVMSVVLEGACAGECVPNADVTDVDDFVTVAPWTIYFQRDMSQNLVAYQWQPMLASGSAYAQDSIIPNPASQAPAAAEIILMQALNHGGFRMLNETTFGYVPLDAMIDDPYGRMPFASILQIIVFDAQILKDLRQWSHVNAFGRIDITVIADMVQALMPPATVSDAQKRINFFTTYLKGIQSAYNDLAPDDTFVHYDNVKVGASDSSGKTFSIDVLVGIIEDRIFRALKQLPILMGSNRGTTETWGTLQMEVYALGIENIQRTVASLMDKLLTAALRIRGRVSIVHSEFARLRASDRSKSAIAEKIEIQNAAAKRDQGWITQDEASIEITKSKAVADAPNPDPIVALGQPDMGASQPAPAPEAQTDGDNPDESDEGASNPKDNAPDEKPKTPPKPTKARLTSSERAAISNAMADLMPDAMRGMKTAQGPSEKRTNIAEATRGAVKAHFASISIPREMIEQFVELAPASRMIAPPYTRAFTDGEKTTLRTAIVAALASHTHSARAKLGETLAAQRLQAWNAAGQEALDRVNLDATFDLTNADLLSGVSDTAQTNADGITDTFLGMLAGALIVSLASGADADQLQTDASAAIGDLSDSRADIVARTETSDAWGAASLETWQRNDVPQKVWATTDDPDPGAGKSGETPCRDNAYASPIDMDDTFPSGNDAPPAHGNCECWLEPSGDPSDAAMADPWTGE